MKQATVNAVRLKNEKNRIYSLELTLGTDKKSYDISEGTYREIGCPLSDDMLNESEVLTVLYEDERRRCLKRALLSLEYSDKSASALRQKLASLHFRRDIIEEVIDECIELGYINEARAVERFALDLANRSLFGPIKIKAKLISRGYSLSEILKAISKLTENGEIDFEKNLSLLLEKKLREYDEEEKKKILYKYGYRYD